MIAELEKHNESIRLRILHDIFLLSRDISRMITANVDFKVLVANFTQIARVSPFANFSYSRSVTFAADFFHK